jgi:hypothetical protein
MDRARATLRVNARIALRIFDILNDRQIQLAATDPPKRTLSVTSAYPT